ncbi:MAG: GyrI-like domain-containing protein [Anaeromicrobium sp.]|jgi:effector-binding domain-containing protein|uniref:GyrI-like domain-containing protein n=1 Tax=Anaeromicrobium sp. TaxID=1929132 RepID=UPI0025FA88B2|nr:GyrI-like domain-containing protein [Anaeromicrobium sp.]MCT4593031.1 GyrI-like domain-containing protein [Anaeromicrobium sp.]
MLEKKLLNIDKKIINLKDMKKSIKRKINESVLWVENNDKINYFVDIIEMEASEAIFIREKIKFEEIGQLIGKLYEIINKFFVKLKNNHMVIIHNRDENEIADVEVFAPIEKTEMVNKISKKRFEGGMFLRTTHNGLRNKGNAYAQLYDFAKENNYKLIEPIIEKYEIKSGKFIIDIMFKVEQ